MEKAPKTKFHIRFKHWFFKHKKAAIIFGAIFTVLIGCLIATLIFLNKPAVKKTVVATKKVAKTTEVVKFYSPLTGSLVADEAATKLAVTGLMIENSPNARPQSGLKNSGVVFEAIAEGGITRFMVLYQSEKPQMIGPIRSVRLYDLDWLVPFNASIGHVGGSAEALAEVRNGSYRDIDQFFNSGAYWRASDRYAPHNVYTSFEKIDALNTSKGYTSSSFTGFSRTDGKSNDAPTATNVTINISSDLYNSTYLYDVPTNTYARSQAGEPHIDREDGQISPSVVIAMMVNETTVLQDGNRESIETLGSGNATIFQNGTAISATWHKPTKSDQITFTDANGADIPLVRGQTWISAVPNDGGSVSWN